MRSLKLLFLLPALAIPLTSCDTTKQAFGMKRSSPNEFTVMKRAPLTIPSNFDLPEPEPGSKDRHELSEPSFSEEAKTIVFENPTVASGKGILTEDDNKFLSKAGVETSEADIRRKINHETYISEKNIVQDEENWLRDAMGIKRKTDKKNVINPQEEAQKLKSEKGNVIVKNPYDTPKK